MSTNSIVAAVQMTSAAEVEANLDRASELIVRARRRGASLVVLPENFAFIGHEENDKFAIAAPALSVGAAQRTTGAIVGRLQKLAAAEQVELILGGFPETADDSADGRGQVHNTSLHIDAAGQITCIYRKIHLFDAQLGAGGTYQESRTVRAGQELVVAQTASGPVGLSICYDLRFPELYRSLVDRGAKIFSIPAAFTLHTGKDHWHVLLRARAIENLSFVIAAAQFGVHPKQRQTYGHALIVDPWGQIVAECSDQEGFAMAELDFSLQERIRAHLPALNHRKLIDFK